MKSQAFAILAISVFPLALANTGPKGAVADTEANHDRLDPGTFHGHAFDTEQQAYERQPLSAETTATAVHDKRSDWEDAYNYAVTWAGTETAGQWAATHTHETTQEYDWYGRPLTRFERRAAPSGMPGGNGDGLGNGAWPMKGNGQGEGMPSGHTPMGQGEHGRGQGQGGDHGLEAGDKPAEVGGMGKPGMGRE